LASWTRAINDRVWAWTRPHRDILYYANGGLGDELIFTAIAHEARTIGNPIHVLTDFPEIWAGNRDAASVNKGIGRWHYIVNRTWKKTRIVHLHSETNRRGRHIAQQMADNVGVTLRPGWRPHIAQGGAVTRNTKRVVLQNSCRGARYAATTKEWPQSQWQELVTRLSDVELIQVGTKHDPLLGGTIDMRGKTTLSTAAALIASASCFVGLESGLMHLAAAVHTPSVIIYGGRTEPAQTGYPFHVHLTRHPACSPCGFNDGCPNGLVCLQIPAHEVEACVRRELSRQAAASAPTGAKTITPQLR